MDVFLPRSLEEALAMKAERPEAVPLAGGTDLMVELNFGRLRPPAIIDLTRAAELATHRQEDGHVFLGAGVTYAAIVNELPGFKPLVQASRSVGSPQIRHRGTVGGNLGTASPAGDALPVLAAYDAEVVLRSQARGERSMPWHAFLMGPKKTAIAPDELIVGARWAAGDTAAGCWPAVRWHGRSASEGCRRGCEDPRQRRMARSGGLARGKSPRVSPGAARPVRLEERLRAR